MSDEFGLALGTGKNFSSTLSAARARDTIYRDAALREIAPRRRSLLFKCALDLILAGLASIFLLPVFAVVAIAVRMDGGPVFYAHSRVGRGGRLFNCYKFRSMRVHGDEILAELLRTDVVAAEHWRINRKLRNDPRVTPIGKILRKTSLDELPQLFNVLRMEMSLVGPRPIVEQEVHMYGTAVSKYYSFRPGLTGVWQISGRSETSFRERVRFDTSYADNWSFWLDMRILFKTVPAVLFGSGAH